MRSAEREMICVSRTLFFHIINDEGPSTANYFVISDKNDAMFKEIP